jgi:formylglycine-generating enzyme required for sulfatase activity
MPSDPTPADSTIDVTLDATLSWTCSDPDADELTYDVYLDTSATPQLASAGQSEATYDPDTLFFNTAYYWKIAAKDDQGNETTGPVWTFSTAPNLPPYAPVPSPTDSSEDIDIGVPLSWTCTDPEGDPIEYDVYFGNLVDPPIVSEGQSETTYQPGYDLNGGTTYYWRVVARDDHENRSDSPVWSFATEREHAFDLGNSGHTMTMVWIEPGSFLMGAKNVEAGAQNDERPRHRVTISDGFWIGKYEVTQQQWESMMGNWTFHFNNHPDRPAEMVSWNHIQTFETYLNNLESGNPWRLPSEAEWEYACRAGHDNTRFWWGDDPGYTQINDYAWHWDNNNTGNGHETHDVGQKLPNPWGLHDVNGNVWEWCEDSYHFNYYGAPADGSAWVDQGDLGRVARGGGWGEYGAQFCRSAARGRDNPLYGYAIFGLRLVRSAE